MHEYNNKHIQTVCPECKNDNILIDPRHGETYCTKCGLILSDNYSIFKITTIIKQEENKNRQINQLWKRVNNDNIFRTPPHK